MDLSFFEESYDSLVTAAVYDDEGVEISPAVYETLTRRKVAPPVITLDDVERVIKRHNANNNKAIRNNVAHYLKSRQWEWLADWEPWKAKNDEDVEWNAEFAGKVSHTDPVFVVDDPETGEGHYEDQDVLHEARELEPEPLRPALVTVDEWLDGNNIYNDLLLI